MYYPLSALLMECIILSIVNDQDSYGYEISRSIKKIASIKESTLYPILKKLELGGLVSTYAEEHNGRNRKYYKISESGRSQLNVLTEHWISYRDEIDKLVLGGNKND
ncbi:MAG: PadR family transcriptional regulator [Bacillota bacterium]|nr:PadR family transcriptional regulator [Bacillota bacterium]